MYKEKGGGSLKETELINLEIDLIDKITEYFDKLDEIMKHKDEIDPELLYLASLTNLACIKILEFNQPEEILEQTVKELEKYKNYFVENKRKFLKVKKLDEVM